MHVQTYCTHHTQHTTHKHHTTHTPHHARHTPTHTTHTHTQHTPTYTTHTHTHTVTQTHTVKADLQLCAHSMTFNIYTCQIEGTAPNRFVLGALIVTGVMALGSTLFAMFYRGAWSRDNLMSKKAYLWSFPWGTSLAVCFSVTGFILFTVYYAKVDGLLRRTKQRLNIEKDFDIPIFT